MRSIKKSLKVSLYNKDVETISDKTERFVVMMNDVKSGFGAWYSILAQIILPMLLFIIPVNVVLARLNFYFMTLYAPEFDFDGPILMVMWVVAMAGLLVLAILLPKGASVFEFVFGFAYLFFAVRYHLYNTPVGIALMICMCVYLAVKLFFLIVQIIGMVKFSHDPKGVERDESGRIVRATEENIFYLDEEEGKKIDETRVHTTADSDFLTEKVSEDTSSAEAAAARMAYDSDFFFDKVVDDKPAENVNVEYDEDVFFVKEEKQKIDKNATISQNDNDYFFG